MEALAGGESVDVCTRFEQWEEWDTSTPWWKHAVAGSCAGVMEHIGMYPLDTIKTHMQALRPGGQVHLSDILRTIAEENGGRGFMRGCSAIASGCVPAHVAMFTSYEFTKSHLSSSSRTGELDSARAAVCGAASTICHDAILTPMDLVKQRMQLGCYRGVGDCLRLVLLREGLGALYRSMPTTMAMNVPFGSVLVATNETLKRRLGLCGKPSRLDDSRSKLPWYFLSAGLSGALASCVTQPLDVVKTRLQTQDLLVHHMATLSRRSPSSSSSSVVFTDTAVPNAASREGCDVCSRCDLPSTPEDTTRHTRTSHAGAPNMSSSVEELSRHTEQKLQPAQPKYTGFLPAVRTIVREEGMLALYNGLLPRFLHAIPSAAMCWGTYEVVKSFLEC